MNMTYFFLLIYKAGYTVYVLNASTCVLKNAEN
jgi:hypothetical protein